MVEDFLARYPELKNVDTGQLSLALEDAALEVSAPVWGKLHQKGVFSLAAHLLYAGGAISDDRKPGEPAQAATSMSGGGLSIGMADPGTGFGANNQGLAMSSYGQEYLRLLQLVGRYMLVVR